MTPLTFASNEIATAYHEAGHAVMALALGRDVQRISVRPNQLRLGQCEIKKGRFRPAKDAVETEILILLGGLAAETRQMGHYDSAGAAQDLRDVRSLTQMRAGASGRWSDWSGECWTKRNTFWTNRGYGWRHNGSPTNCSAIRPSAAVRPAICLIKLVCCKNEDGRQPIPAEEPMTNGHDRATSGEDFLHHVSLHVGQPKVRPL